MIGQRIAGCSPFLQAVLQGAMVAVLSIAVAGCSASPPQIAVEVAYAERSPVFLGAGSVYLTIRNDGGGDALLGAATALQQAVVELHDVKDGRMVRVKKIDVPSRSTVEFKPGSLHIMVFNMPKTVQSGSELELTLRFERSGDKKVTVRFQK